MREKRSNGVKSKKTKMEGEIEKYEDQCDFLEGNIVILSLSCKNWDLKLLGQHCPSCELWQINLLYYIYKQFFFFNKNN